jgi:hydroxyacylglutathione hydrolase
MSLPITTIGLGGVNCFLLAAGEGFVLVDTGLATKRGALLERLLTARCAPGALKLVVLTHGDVDHAGNAAYLRTTFDVPVAIHPDDAGMVETGDTDWNRKTKPDHLTLTGRFIRLAGTGMELFRRGGAIETFTPDLLVEDGFGLAPYGLEARIVHLPGHSKGSIGVLTAEGDLVCGDLIYCWTKPSVPIKDDAAAHRASMLKLRDLGVRMVYPGHGKPFAWSDELAGSL